MYLRPTLEDIPEDHFPALIDNLYSLGLSSVQRDILGITMSGSGILTKRTTPLSDRYIQFITMP